MVSIPTDSQADVVPNSLDDQMYERPLFFSDEYINIANFGF